MITSTRAPVSNATQLRFPQRSCKTMNTATPVSVLRLPASQSNPRERLPGLERHTVPPETENETEKGAVIALAPPHNTLPMQAQRRLPSQAPAPTPKFRNESVGKWPRISNNPLVGKDLVLPRDRPKRKSTLPKHPCAQSQHFPV